MRFEAIRRFSEMTKVVRETTVSIFFGRSAMVFFAIRLFHLLVCEDTFLVHHDSTACRFLIFELSVN
jgi:hypothetical protein